MVFRKIQSYASVKVMTILHSAQPGLAQIN